MKHTQCPLIWETHSNNEPNQYRIRHAHGRRWIASILHNGEQHVDEQEANLRLWAAAPDLLEALRYAKEILESYKTTHVGVHNEAIAKAGRAIVKATGEA